ncbi:hypothetical protein LPJ59_000140, partial [Coemansia sp. RSA 2399]
SQAAAQAQLQAQAQAQAQANSQAQAAAQAQLLAQQATVQAQANSPVFQVPNPAALFGQNVKQGQAPKNAATSGKRTQ